MNPNTCSSPGCDQEVFANSYQSTCGGCHQQFCLSHIIDTEYPHLCARCYRRRRLRWKVLLPWVSVDPQQAYIVNRWGRFHRVVRSGISDKVPLLDVVVDVVDLKTAVITLPIIRGFTQDSIPIGVEFAMHVRVNPDQVELAYFQATDPLAQMTSVIHNATQRRIGELLYDRFMADRQGFENLVLVEAQAMAEAVGYHIERLIMTDLRIDAEILRQRKKTAQTVYQTTTQYPWDQKQAVQEAMLRLSTLRLEMEAWIERAKRMTEAAMDRKKMRTQAATERMKMEADALRERIAEWVATLQQASAAIVNAPGVKMDDVRNLTLLVQYLEAVRQGNFQGGQTLNYLTIIDSILSQLRSSLSRSGG